VVPEMSATQPTNPPGSPAFEAEIDELVRILKTPRFRPPHNSPTVPPSSEAAATMIERLRQELRNLVNLLAECYRLTGADPDGNEDWRLAPHAVAEVRRLRAEHDAAEHAAPSVLDGPRPTTALDLEYQKALAMIDALRSDRDGYKRQAHGATEALLESMRLCNSYRDEIAQLKAASGQPASETRRSGFTPCAECQHHDFCRSWCDGVGRCAQTLAGVPHGTVNADSATKAGNA